jgi:phage-related baseplate assembly protein
VQTVEQLSADVDPEAALNDVFEIVRNVGFDTTVAEQDRQVGWSVQSGSFLLVTATIAAKLWTYLAEGSKTRTLAMRLETATKTALTWWGVSQYQEKRKAAVNTQGIYVLTDAKGVGPLVLAANGYVFKDPVSGVTFRNITGGTLPLNGSLSLNIECEQAGTIGNSPNGRITSLVTSISGVTGTNPAQALTGTWITRTGINEESDTAYKRRCSLKWSTLGPNAPKSAYEWFALNALDSGGNPVGISKVKCSPPNGYGQFFVYISNDVATATPTQVSDVQAWIDARKNPTAQATVAAATEVPVNLTFNLICSRGRGAAAAAQAQIDIEAYINSLDINGTKVDQAGTGFVLVSEMIEAAMKVGGVIDVKSNAMNDGPLTVSQKAVPGTILVNYREV